VQFGGEVTLIADRKFDPPYKCFHISYGNCNEHQVDPPSKVIYSCYFRRIFYSQKAQLLTKNHLFDLCREEFERLGRLEPCWRITGKDSTVGQRDRSSISTRGKNEDELL